MTKRWLPYVIFGLVFYLLFLAIELPAAWFAWGLNRYSGGLVRLDPISGSLWHGSGRLVIYYPQATPHDLGTIEWRINPLWLIAGRLQAHWRAEAPDTRLDVTMRLGSGEVRLLDTEAAFPARHVGAFYPPASLISPQGMVQLRVPRLALARDGITGHGDIQWLDAGSALTTVQPLGDYRLEITGAGKTADLKLATLRGALDLNGQGQWQLATGRITLNGNAIPRAHGAELEPLLKLIGDDQGGGKRSLAFEGIVPWGALLR
jgi:general secretion pathway protein N